MYGLENVTVTGRLTRDPDLKFRHLEGGEPKPVAHFAVVVPWREQRPDGSWLTDEARTTFIEVSVWGTVGEHAARSLKAGDTVIMVGPLRTSRYTTNKGEAASRLELTARQVGVSLQWTPVIVERTDQ
jgi:single stranded DNA-binding protein